MIDSARPAAAGRRDIGDERTLHRLEAFSDIVIGFSLAEVALNLAVPNSLPQMRLLWETLTAFCFSFTLISIVWWYHHKLFVTYVFLNPATVALNFAMLASLALAIYFQQIAVHFIALGIEPSWPIDAWLGCMAATFAALAGMYAVGIWKRPGLGDAAPRHWALSLTFQMAVSALGLAGLSLTFPAHPAAAAAIILLTGIAAAFRGRIARTA